MQNCSRKDTRDIGQLMLSKTGGSVATWSSKVDAEKLSELIVVAIVKHNLRFQRI